jgi:hypothetical protein
MTPRPETPRHGSIAFSLSVLLLVATAGACGDSDSAAADGKTSSSSKKLDAGFISRAEAACAPYAEYQSTTFLEVYHFNRYAPDPEVLPQVATHLEKDPSFKTLVSDLSDLGEPESGATAWHAVLDDFGENDRIIGLEIEAARAGDAAQFGDLVGQFEENKTPLNADRKTAGLTGSSCAEVELDPLNPPKEVH